MPSPVIQDWLKRVLVPYPSAADLAREVGQALDRFPTLQVRTEAYTYDSGQTHLLLQSHGTLPITYRNATYHIPLCIWFPLEYPRKAPMVYVQPTREMAIRRSAEVDPSGRVVGGEVADWERKWEGHSLASLLANLQEIFSAQPPVYARPPTQPSDAPPRPPARPAPPVSSIPDQLPMYRPPPAGPPPLSVNTSPRPPNSAAGPPPVPPSPLRLHTRQDSLPGQATVTGSPLQAYAAPGQLIPDPRNSPPVTGPPLARRPHEMYRPQITSPANGYSPDAYRPVGQQQAPRSPHATPQPRSAPKPPIRDLFDVDDEGLAPITPQSQSPAPFAEGVAPPSRPLPPTTLHLHSLLSAQLAARLPLLLSHLTSQTTQLESVRADLESGEAAIRDEMARLEAVRGVCEGVVAKVGEVVKNGEKRCEELEQRGEVSVDEVVCSISIVHNQLIDLVAEDNAIEDTIYHLARALDAERIDLDRFLKQIRILGREQYQKRALIEKITMELRGRL